LLAPAALAAVVETLVHAALAMAIMLHMGVGGTIVFIVLPLLWLALAARLWVGLWIASALAGRGGLQFVLASSAVGLVSAVFFVVLAGGATGRWADAWPLPVWACSHALAAALVLRSGRERARQILRDSSSAGRDQHARD
jgi:hypothetical protein